jgi:hypothetical protein
MNGVMTILPTLGQHKSDRTILTIVFHYYDCNNKYQACHYNNSFMWQ